MLTKLLKLGTVCQDQATQLKGTLTHFYCNIDGEITYLFQPEGINPEDGQPVTKFAVESGRLRKEDRVYDYIDLPSEILGSTVSDKASGFTGMAVALKGHINGCLHVIVQPPGVIARTNSPIRKTDFDLRSCRGEKIPELNEDEKQNSRARHPSPEEGAFEDPS